MCQALGRQSDKTALMQTPLDALVVVLERLGNLKTSSSYPKRSTMKVLNGVVSEDAPSACDAQKEGQGLRCRCKDAFGTTKEPL